MQRMKHFRDTIACDRFTFLMKFTFQNIISYIFQLHVRNINDLNKRTLHNNDKLIEYYKASISDKIIIVKDYNKSMINFTHT